MPQTKSVTNPPLVCPACLPCRHSPSWSPCPISPISPPLLPSGNSLSSLPPSPSPSLSLSSFATGQLTCYQPLTTNSYLYEGQCKQWETCMKKPPDSRFTDIFAPNCEVVATSLTPITGCLISTAKNIVKHSATCDDY